MNEDFNNRKADAGHGSGAPQRDAKGRWKKGSSGNSKGARPKKRRLEVPSQIGRDVLAFNRQEVFVPGPNGSRKTTRGELYIESVYAKAIKGGAAAQKLWREMSQTGIQEQLERHPCLKLAESFRQLYEDPTKEPDPAMIGAVDVWLKRAKRL